MKVLFMTLVNIESFDQQGIYEDLIRAIARKGHDVYVVSPTERRNKQRTFVKNIPIDEGDLPIKLLKVKTGNIQKSGIIEKGIATLLLEVQYWRAIKKHFGKVQFDLLVYSTPPITLEKVVRKIKIRDNCRTYLLLKDIFPQNAVDLGMLSSQGFLYNYFRRKEVKLYSISDRIGCMSPANVEYLLKKNPLLSSRQIEVFPNSLEVLPKESITNEERLRIRKLYGLPENAVIFVYGGNLGKPQGVPFILECLRSQANKDDVFFLIIGSGTEYQKIQNYLKSTGQQNVKIVSQLPRMEYNVILTACDIGLIFLDFRFTIPNFPSRILGYMQARMPVLACTDLSTDVGHIIVNKGFGWWCSSNSFEEFDRLINDILMDKEFTKKGEAAYLFLLNSWNVGKVVELLFES